MKLNIYSTYDVKTKEYHQNIAVLKTHEEAIRAFKTSCQNPKSQLNQFPEDFTFHHLAEIDTESGKITPVPNITVLTTASEHVTKEAE